MTNLDSILKSRDITLPTKVHLGKTIEWKDQRSLQENQRHQGNISCKDGHNKGQKWYGPNRSRNLRRGGKNTQKTYTKKKNHNGPDNNDGVILTLGPEMQKCKVKWALKTITAKKVGRGVEFQLRYFKS